MITLKFWKWTKPQWQDFWNGLAFGLMTFTIPLLLILLLMLKLNP